MDIDRGEKNPADRKLLSWPGWRLAGSLEILSAVTSEKSSHLLQPSQAGELQRDTMESRVCGGEKLGPFVDEWIFLFVSLAAAKTT